MKHKTNEHSKQGKKVNNKKSISSTKSKGDIFTIQSKYIMKLIFAYLPYNRKYIISHHSNRLQKLLGISLITYQMIHFLSDKSLKLNFIQLIETIKCKYPNSSSNDIIEFLYNKHSKDTHPIILTQITHDAIPMTNSLLQLNTFPIEQGIHITITNNRHFTQPLSSYQISLMKYTTTFTYDFPISTINEKGFEILCDNLSHLPVKHVSHLQLSGLKLNYCLHKEKFFSVIEGFKALTMLDLSSNSLKDEGMVMLGKSIHKENITRLTSLRLADNYLSDVCLAFIEMIMKYAYGSLKMLDISGNFFSGKSVKAIIKYTDQLTHLNYSNNPIPNEGLITLLSSINSTNSLRSILELCLANINIQPLLLLPSIELFTNLSNTPLLNLDFSGNEMQGVSLSLFTAHIAPIKSLQSLKLSHFYIQDPTSLDSLSNLSELSLSFSFHIDNIFSHSFNLTNLTALQMNLCTFTNNYPSMEFMRSLTKLTILDLSNCNIQMEVFSSLWKCFTASIKELRLSHNDFTTKSVIALSSALITYTNLTVFDISNNAISKDELRLFMQSIVYCKQMTIVNFTNIPFDYDNFALLLKALRQLTYITEVYLFNIGMTDNQLKDICENNELLIRIKVMNISKNSINNNGINELMRRKSLFVNLERLLLMQLTISTQMKEDLKGVFGDAVYLK